MFVYVCALTAACMRRARVHAYATRRGKIRFAEKAATRCCFCARSTNWHGWRGRRSPASECRLHVCPCPAHVKRARAESGCHHGSRAIGARPMPSQCKPVQNADTRDWRAQGPASRGPGARFFCAPVRLVESETHVLLLETNRDTLEPQPPRVSAGSSMTRCRTRDGRAMHCRRAIGDVS